MRSFAVVCLVAMSAVRAAEGQDPLPTPAEQFEALRKETNQAGSGGAPRNDAERLQFVGQAYRRRHALALKFLELADQHPDDPIALDALLQAVWQVNSTPWPVELVGEDTARGRAFERIQREHIASNRLGPLCLRVSYGFAKEYETFLRAVLARNTHREVLGMASLGLAHFLDNRRLRIELLRGEPRAAQEFSALYGGDYLAELRGLDRDVVAREAEALLRQAVDKYGNVETDSDTVGERAKVELFALTHLAAGKEAPDIEGEDQDGARFKLGDYRGKAVLLDFWSYG